MTARWPKLVVAAGFAASATASLLGSAPAWPTPVVWATLGYLAALGALAFTFRPSIRTLEMMTVLATVAALARGTGYIVLAPTVAGKLAAGGAWMIVAGLSTSFHKSRRVML